MSIPQKLTRVRHGGNRAVALILVLSFLVLITVLVIAFFSTVAYERSAATSSANGISSRELADTAVQIVLGNIKSGAQSKNANGNIAWASQPGMIRTYDATGNPVSNYKLYSSDNMVVNMVGNTTGFDPGTDFDPQWASKSAMFTDLNSPISSGGNTVFPIIDGNKIKSLSLTTSGQSTTPYLSYDDYDPKNYPGVSGHQDGLPDIEGFGVDSTVITSTAYNPSQSPSTTNTPVPMPVKWMYVLRDGTLTTPSSVDITTGKIASFATGPTQPSTANPIVGRMAFWTDDESAKININTASEGSFNDTPRAQGVTDVGLAYMPPAQKEYQRYPGHPFTTSLSTVLGGIFPVDHTLEASLNPNPGGSFVYTSTKPVTYNSYKPYYDLAPRLNIDRSSNPTASNNLGSSAGTYAFANNNYASLVDPALLIKGDRLFTDVSELMFEPAYDTSNNRIVTNTENNTISPPLTAPFVNRAKFFLTASSRAPDVNLYGLPRIVTWPISELPTGATSTAYRTFLDSQIAFCGTINPTNNYTYYFQRFRNDHPTYDLPATAAATGVGRNRTLMNYLKMLTGGQNGNQTYPSIPGFGGNFNTKYPSATVSGVTVSERDQILTEIFDYIRCLNLWDQSELGYDLANKDTSYTYLRNFHPYAPPAKAGWTDGYNWKYGTTTLSGNCTTTNNIPQSYNYTSSAAYTSSASPTFPTPYESYASNRNGIFSLQRIGMGQVVPIYDTLAKTRGFGRFPTISEVSLVFVATGWNDGMGGQPSDPNYQGIATGANAPSQNPVPPGSLPGTLPTYIAGNTDNMDTSFYVNSYTPTDETYPGLGLAPWGFFNAVPTTTTYPVIKNAITWPDHPMTSWGAASYQSVTNRTSQLNNVSMPKVDPRTVQVQAMLLISWFDPAQGHLENWGTYNVQIDGLDQFKWGTGGAQVSMGFPKGYPSAASGTSPTSNAASVSKPTSDNGLGYGVSWGGNMGFRNFLATREGGEYVSEYFQKYYPYMSLAHNFAYDPNLGRVTPSTPPPPQPFNFTGGKITINILLPPSTPPATPAASNWPISYGILTSDALDVPQASPTSFPQPVPVQQIEVNFPSGTFPLPYYGPPAQNYDGLHGRGDLNDRFLVDTGLSTKNSNTRFISPGDTVRSIRAYPGDVRIIAGRVKVDDSTGLFDTTANSANISAGLAGLPATWNYGDSAARQVHSLRDCNDTVYNGAILGQLVKGVSYYNSTNSLSPTYDQSTNTPPVAFSSAGNCAINGAFMNNASMSPGDWDNGFAQSADGPYINKPEEGAFNYYGDGNMPYFGDAYTGALNQGLGSTFFSPNRLMPSPVMFGSLSTGVARNMPWQTLLFCPNPPAGNNHPGFGTGSTGVGPNAAAPFTTPPDHLLLDLFNMPVVEPYPISEPLSTAGRINMNYQIAPFTYITRNTGLRAVLKAERLTAIPNAASLLYKKSNDNNGVGSFPLNSGFDYRIPINADETLKGFDNYFTTRKDIFRSASQICEMFLYPTRTANLTSGAAAPTYDSANANINAFWAVNQLTGDNSREKPYADIYPRLTTKSNTFTVHMRVQTLKKSTNTDPTTWVEGQDSVQSEYRGSSTVERYVDPADPTLLDYTDPTVTDTLDSHYKFRVISNTQFSH